MGNKYPLSQLFLLLFVFVFGIIEATAQLVVTPPAPGTPAQHAQQLAQSLVGTGVTISNPQITGAAGSYGFFNGTNSNIGIGQGVILTTGSIQNAVGPNNSGSQSTSNNVTAPNPFLAAILPTADDINDMVMLEFDLQVESDTVRFEYVFGSEEYLEFACSSFNDVFGFFISGPGIVSNVPGMPGVRNIALLPGTNNPVTINSVNTLFCGSANAQYYVNNGDGTTPALNPTVQYDGFTTVLTAMATGLIPCQTYHLRLAIADVSDFSWDSGVFIKAGSLNAGVSFSANTSVGNAVYPNALEGCVNGGFAVKRSGDLSTIKTVEFSIGGTATNGVDYTDLFGMPVDSSITFQAYEDSIFIHIIALQDNIVEPQETVIFTLKSSCTNQVTGDPAILYIDDTIPFDLGLDRDYCDNVPLQLQGHQPGFSGTGIIYSWTPSGGLSAANIPNPVVSNISGTVTYSVTVTMGNCTVTDSITLSEEPVPVNPAGPDFASCAPGTGQLQGSGGGTYSWTGPNGFNSTLQNPTFNYTNPGTYNLTVTTPAGCVYTDQAVVSYAPTQPVLSSASTAVCEGQSVQLQTTVAPGSGTLTYQFTPVAGLSATNIANPVATPAATTTYTVIVTDQASCSDTATVTITVNQFPQITAGPDLSICPGESVQLQGALTNTLPGVTFSWSNAGLLSSGTVLTPLATPVANTTFVLTASNGSCVSTDEVNVTIKPLPDFSTSATPLGICAGQTITLPATDLSGLPGITYTWSPAASLVQSNVQNPVAFPTDTTTYTATATLNGCSVTQTVTVNVTPAPIISAGADTSICAGASTVLTGTDAASLPGTTYTWSNAGLLSSGTILTPAATPTETTTFVLTATNGTCVMHDTVVVEVRPLPVFSAGSDQELCPQDVVTLGEPGAAGVTYSWSPAAGLVAANVPEPLAYPTVTTTYTVTATLNGCSITDQVTVTAKPSADIVAGSDQILCPNQPAVTLTAFENTGQPGIAYSWVQAGQTTVLSQDLTAVVNPSATSSYVISATLGSCTVRDTLTVVVVPAMNLSIQASPEGGLAPLEVQFGATGSNLVSYHWDFGVPGIATDVSEQAAPAYTYTMPGQYSPILIATDNMGCSDTATYQFIRVSYGVPNIFTPNGDGVNDAFNVGILRSNTSLRVFSRWGKLVYESNNYQNDWTANGVPDGVYYYRVTFPDSGEEFNGWVEIQR